MTGRIQASPAALHLQGPVLALPALAVHRLVEEQVRLTPEATALQIDGQKLSYAQLNERANQLAHLLLEKGVQRGAVVAICAARSLELGVALLAVLKTGAAYLPLDPAFPAERLRFMLEDAACPLILAQLEGYEPMSEAARTMVLNGALPVINLALPDAQLAAAPSHDPALACSPDDDFCLLYTSGSTGTPKGVPLSHANVSNLLHWMQQEYRLTPADRVLQKTPYSFDVSMYEIFWPWLVGATVVLAEPEGHRDPAYLAALIESAGITACHFVPSMLAAFLEEPTAARCRSLKQVFAAGEALPYALTQRFFAVLPATRLHNLYGPTEAGVVSYWECPHQQAQGIVPIGRAVANTSLYLLDEQLAEVPAGSEGMLWIGGAQVAQGYLGRIDLSAERFIAHPQFGRIYKSGDQARLLPDGTLEYLGRADFQVKIRGIRIELGELESALQQHPQIIEAAAGLHHDASGEPLLVAWFAARGTAPTANALREYLAERLPEHLLPQHFVLMAALPQLPNGKVNRRALPAPAAGRPQLAVAYAAPVGALEAALHRIWSALLGFAEVGRDDPFFEVGGTSLKAAQAVARISAMLGERVAITRFFAAPTIAGLAESLMRHHSESVSKGFGLRSESAAKPALLPVRRAQASDTSALAIVGMAARLPGADDLEAFWQLLLAGREGLCRLTPEELSAAGVPADLQADAHYVPVAGRIENADCFDHEFFGVSPREAQLMDPQQRLLLESAWHALEHAGTDPQRYGGRIGVFASTARNHYYWRNLASHAEHRQLAMDYLLLGNDKDYAATRIAHKLNLTGPALTVQTACSSSGTALHLAGLALKAGDCDLALVAAAAIPLPWNAGYLAQDDGPLSRDGHIRAFDASASGMVLTAGVLSVVLKRLEDAIADGDTIYAAIRGSAINNDGAEKAAFTAPSVDGQAAVISAALANAGVAPESVSYLEAHGTATPLGDPIELAALTQAYAGLEQAALGSVKSNIGHLDGGAALAGILKTTLALHHRQLPASLHFAKPNPDIEFGPFAVNTALRDWDAPFPRRAGVSSFGFGGTNFHALLEESRPVETAASARPWQLLRLSAKSDAALQQQAGAVAEAMLDATPAQRADTAYTLDVGRVRLPRRGIAVLGNSGDIGKLITGSPLHSAPSLVWMFPGQGAQHPRMAEALYASEPVFRQEFDACADIVLSLIGEDLRSVLFSPAEDAAEKIRATQLAQPAIFSVSYALAKLWLSWGAKPAALIGHSVGEFAAATIAGVFSLKDALEIIAARAKLMQAMPAGGMMAVRLSEAAIQPWLGAGVDLAGLNAPQLCVVAGPHEALDALASRLQVEGVGCTPLHTSHAFHSAMMDPAVQPFAEIIARHPRGAAAFPIYSTVTGKLASDAELQNPMHWARQLREPVRFAPALGELLTTPGRVLLEVGPGQNLSTSARQAISPVQQAQAVASLPHAGAETADAAQHLTEAIGRLWLAGIELDTTAFYAGEKRQKLGLAPYPFARHRHWIEPAVESSAAAASTAPASAEPVAAAAAPQADGDLITPALLKLMQGTTGYEFVPEQRARSFLELGFDSLMLTQVAGRLKAEFKVDLRFRQLLEDISSFELLAGWLKTHSQGTPGLTASAAKAANSLSAPDGNAPAAPAKTFGAGTRINKAKGDELSPAQRASLTELSARYLAKTGKSKAFAQANRGHLADARTVSGFRPLVKELIYPIVTDRSDGAYLWDLDGNQYIDTTNGFGSVFWGHKPKFVADAVREQLDKGWEIGPQTPLAGECAKLFAEMTGLPRVTFCNTGSEAVLAAMRISRTATGRNLIVSFSGDYHGIQDEVIVRPTPSGRSVPAAPGIPNESVANTLIIDYGLPKSLEILKERGDEIAAVMIEPVQSRRADWQPREFLHEVRRITRDCGAAMIMDEVITGFRSAPGGAQEYFGVQADIGTYGKVFGGGLPIGAIAGIPRFMDALDGGHWQYGDDSVPEAGVTYFAGTFVRHPIILAGVKACLENLRDKPGQQRWLARRTEQMVDIINTDFEKAGAPMHVANFTSLWKPEYTTDQTHGDIFFFFLRANGLHIWEGRPCFMTMAHSDADIERIIQAFRDAVEFAQQGGWFEGGYRQHEVFRAGTLSPYLPPLPGARVGRDAEGNAAWFVADAEQPQRWRKVEMS